ncbi:hypothetical protein ACEQ8H_000566 [Pleosporales sp. CAS-2024a]
MSHMRAPNATNVSKSVRSVASTTTKIITKTVRHSTSSLPSAVPQHLLEQVVAHATAISHKDVMALPWFKPLLAVGAGLMLAYGAGFAYSKFPIQNVPPGERPQSWKKKCHFAHRDVEAARNEARDAKRRGREADKIDMAELKKEIADGAYVMTVARAEIHELREKNSLLEKEKSLFQDGLMTAQADYLEAEMENDEQMEEIVGLRQQNLELGWQVYALYLQLGRPQSMQIQDSDTIGAQFAQDVGNARQDVERLQDEQDESRQEIAMLRKQLDEANSVSAILRENLDKECGRANGLQGALEKSEAAFLKAQKERDSNEHQLRQYHKEDEQEMCLQAETIKDLEEHVHDLTVELEKKDGKIVELEGELQEARDELARPKTDKTTASNVPPSSDQAMQRTSSPDTTYKPRKASPARGHPAQAPTSPSPTPTPTPSDSASSTPSKKRQLTAPTASEEIEPSPPKRRASPAASQDHDASSSSSSKPTTHKSLLRRRRARFVQGR